MTASTAARRLFALLAVTAMPGCVSPHLEGLATAECASAADCADGLACVEGRCGDAPPPRPDESLPDEGLPDTDPPDTDPPDMADAGDLDADVGPDPDLAMDAEPDVADTLPDVTDALPDVADMLLDGPVDMAVDMVVDMEVDAACEPVDERCDGVDDDCDEVIDEGEGPALCPDLPPGVATTACVEGACAIADCAEGREDVDGLPDNGCECVVFDGFAVRGLPEPAGIDANCDGVVGVEPGALFVSAAGPDDGDGSAERPLPALDAALLLAAEDPASTRAVIVLDGGVYEPGTPIGVAPDRTLVIVGGFVWQPDGAPSWTRDPAPERPLIDVGAASPGVRVPQGAELVLDGVRVFAAAAPRPVGIRGLACAGIALHDTELEVVGPLVGADHDGADGTPGDDAPPEAADGQPGTADGVPGPGGENPACIEAGGGAGGAAIAGQPAGAGGEAAVDGVALGGQGATADGAALPGSAGRAGAHGAAGRPASPAGRWRSATNEWVREAPEAAPADGERGGGGGGGGGGAGDGAAPGAGGGGGGAGGCGGSAGRNGLGGAGVFGVIVTGGCPLVLSDSRIIVAAGGDGGAGGPGGRGGTGGAGGPAGELAGALQPAAEGGPGGDGGCGGDGAGGPGGPSLGVLRIGDTPAPELSGEVEFQIADPAPGGAAGSNPACPRDADSAAPDGVDGIALEIGCCPADGTSCVDLRCAE